MKRATGPTNGLVAILIVTMAMVANADTFYVNGSCGNDDWTGTSSVCSEPNGPKLTIQAGIDASVNGDEVLVSDGTYMGAGNKNLDYGGRLITLRSENGPATCIIDCEADGRGIFFHNGETAEAVLEGFTIRNGNSVGAYGGAILCEGASPTVNDCTFSGNSAERGGGMYNLGSPTLTNCTFTNNAATGPGFFDGGAGLFNDGGNPTLTNCTFSGNTSSRHGGGIHSINSNPTLTNCTFSGNSATNGGGGGMYNFPSDPTLTNCTFSGNSAAHSGGGMYNNISSPTLINCTFTDNTSDVFGGGGTINIHGSGTVTNCTFTDNAAASSGGGMSNSTSSPTVTDCTFSGNSAGISGGGMNNSSSSPTISNCTFTNNTSSADLFGDDGGGGMHNTNSSSPTVTNCTFTNNAAVEMGGGMYNRRSSSPAVADCTFSGNSAGLEGGGMNNNSSSPTVTNCILWHDSPDEIVDVNGSITTVRFSDVQRGWPGTGNIDGDPRFVDPANDDYRLAPGSPCIDAADNTAVPAGILTDLDGKPRFVDDPATPDTGVPGGAGGDAIVDMGAYEFPCDACDMNCDGDINALDIEFFIDVLFNGATPCDPCTGDTNGDGLVNAEDIEGFINCLFP